MHICRTLPEIICSGWNAKKKKKEGRDRYIGRWAKYPDEDILTMRRQSEINRKTFQEICGNFPTYQKKYIREVLEYTIRAHLRVS